MTMAVAALGSLLGVDITWSENWAWGLPLIVLTVVMHVLCLGLMYQRVVHPYNRKGGHPAVVFIVVMGTTTLLATCLHGGEAAVWALAYRLLNALPDNRSALRIRSVRSQAMVMPIWFWSHTGSSWERWKL